MHMISSWYKYIDLISLRCDFQVVSQYSNILSPLCVDAVMKVIDPATATNVDLHDIKIIKKLG